MQRSGLLVIWLSADHPDRLPVYLLALTIAGIGAAIYMDNLDHQTSKLPGWSTASGTATPG